jgi:folate-dependent phosphoribosylglycinamide formyltransferase PurN
MIAGDDRTGVTIMRVTEGLDSGPIALQRSEPVEPEDTAGTLGARLARAGGALLVEALDRAEAGALELTEQEEDGATYASKIDAAERRLWTDTLLKIADLYRKSLQADAAGGAGRELARRLSVLYNAISRSTARPTTDQLKQLEFLSGLLNRSVQ